MASPYKCPSFFRVIQDVFKRNPPRSSCEKVTSLGKYTVITTFQTENKASLKTTLQHSAG